MYNMLLTGTKVNSSDSVEIKLNRRASEKEGDVKLEKKDTNVSLAPFDSPFRLYYDDLKSMLTRCMILRQVLGSLLIAFSSELFKNGENVFILPESFFSLVHDDISLEKSILGSCGDIDFIVAVSFFNRHWSLILIDVEEEIIYYLDPLFGYVPEEKLQQDILILKKIVWQQLLNSDLDSAVPLEIPGWQIVTSNTFSNFSKKPLPKQRNDYDCGSFSVINFYYIVTRTTIDFHPGDMDSIRKWSMNILLNISQIKDLKSYEFWFVSKMSSNRLCGLKLIVSNTD